MLVIMIFLSIITYYFSSVSIVEVKVDKIVQTQATLNRARQALLDFAAVNWLLPGEEGEIGKLPCPDYNSNNPEGEQDGNCGLAYANAIGYFPWRTLGIDITKDSSGSCLLYVVSPAYKTSPAAALTPDSFGQLRTVDNTGAVVSGNAPEDRPVAVIIAPDAALLAQARENNPGISCGSYYGDVVAGLIAAYLDSDMNTNNAAINPAVDNVIENLVSHYAVAGDVAPAINDRLMIVTYEELWQAVNASLAMNGFESKMRNLTEALALCLVEYAEYNETNASTNNRSLPWPAAMNLNGNEYRNSVSYDDNDNHNDGYSGRLPYQVLNSNDETGNGLTESGPPYAGFMEYSFCNNLTLADGTVIDLTDKAGEYWKLWSNWKEYFFYALSEAFSPENDGDSCGSECIQLSGEDKAAIVFFSGVKMTDPDTGYVQQRYSRPFDQAFANTSFYPLNEDDKDDIRNYLEGDTTLSTNNIDNFPVFSGNPLTFSLPSDDGNREFFPVAAAPPAPPPPAPAIPGSNDIMFCIETNLSNDLVVNECL